MKHQLLISLSSLLVLAAGCKNKYAEDGDGSAQADKAVEKTAAAQAESAEVAPEPKKEAPQPEPKKDTIPAPNDVAAPPANAEKSPSGLAWVVLKKGTGDKSPGPTDKVTVHYTGWTKDGKMFDSSEVRGRSTTFAVNRVIKGWTEALQLMKEGERRRVWIPANLAYGEKPARPGTPAGQLTFDVELLKILSPPETPKDVAAPPAGAKKTASGLAYMELKPGKPDGKTPSASSRVTVHYSGWTKDGKMFDSSITRGNPATFPLSGVIKGWTEGLQLMKEGATYRFWIPGDLAYGEKPRRPGAPSGQLTFDVELLSVE
jgi:peptidylprolyl isomerase